MKIFLFIPIAAFIVIFVHVMLKNRGARTVLKEPEKTPDVTFPYTRVSSLLTPAEFSFFNVLVMALGDEVRVVVKPRLSDLVALVPGISRSERQSAHNRINQKHVDFVVCDRSFVPICVIELDDSSHARSERVERDAFVDGVCKAAGLPIIHQAARAEYAIEALRQAVAAGKVA